MVDVLLVERAANCDMDAFGAIYETVYPKAVQYLRSLSGNADIAEQIVQDTVVYFMQDNCKAIKALQDFSSFEPYFLQSAKNRYFNLYKSKRTKSGDVREVYVDEIYDVNEDGELDDFFGANRSITPEEYAEHEEIKEILTGMINELPDTQKEAFNLFVIGDMKQSEIAKVMDVPLNTVKSYLQYAKKKLSAKIEEYEKKNDIKLHSVLPILPFLRFMYGSEKFTTPEFAALLGTAGAAATATAATTTTTTVAAATTVASVEAATATATAATAATAKAASTATVTAVAAKAGAGLATKIIAGVVAAAVIGVSVTSLPDIVRNVHRAVQVQHSSEEQEIVQSTAENEGQDFQAAEEEHVDGDAAFSASSIPMDDESIKTLLCEEDTWHYLAVRDLWEFHFHEDGTFNFSHGKIASDCITDSTGSYAVKDGTIWMQTNYYNDFHDEATYSVEADPNNSDYLILTQISDTSINYMWGSGEEFTKKGFKTFLRRGEHWGAYGIAELDENGNLVDTYDEYGNIVEYHYPS